ncbi:hypothetical protein RJ639_003820, partial [Escallonia herrerae]
DALNVWRSQLPDPCNVLQSWDPTLGPRQCRIIWASCNRVRNALQSFEYLDVSRNNLSGPISSEIGNLTILFSLVLDHNQLTSSIPPTLGNLKLLRYLYKAERQSVKWQSTNPTPPTHLLGQFGSHFGFNMAIWVLFHLFVLLPLLSSTASANTEGEHVALWILFISIMVFMILSAITTVWPSNVCGLSGDALYALRRAVNDPENVLQSWDPTLVDPCTWFHVTCDSDNRVTRLDLGNAKLSGNLVPELGKLERLQYLELYMNSLVGSVPAELGGLKSLVSLDLYHNNLTGTIPPSLSKLSNLRFLRLNRNKLTGRIPRKLTKLGNLKILDVSNNDLCGTIPTSGSFTKFTEESFVNNPRLEGPELMGFVRYDIGGCK